MVCYCVAANGKITTAQNIYKKKTHCPGLITASVNLLVSFMADIKTTRLLLDVSVALWVGVSLFRSVKTVYSCYCCFLMLPLLRQTLHQFLGLKEALEVLHLPNPGDDEDERLSDGPPENALVGALARHAKALLAIL